MRDIKKLKGKTLRWFRFGWVRGSHELTGDDGETYATLVWKGVFTEKAIASCAYGDFELRWRGFIRRHVPIMDTASNQEIGRLRLGIKDSGVLELDNGRKYKFRSTSVWKSRWIFVDDLGGTVCSIGYSGWLKLGRRGGEVLLGPAAVLDRDLILMMMVGWYAMNVISQESYVAATAGG
jgi:hypothetical protein